MFKVSYSPEEQRGEATGRQKARRSLTEWARLAQSDDQQPVRHHLHLIAALRDVCNGSCDRLMVLMPPGSAKSTYASVLFPVFWFMRHPTSNVIACSHTAALAESFGGRVRALLAERGYQLDILLGGRRARHDFAVEHGGTYYCTGVQGSVTGRRADLILIDDPVRSYEDADSPVRRDALWNWYRSDLLTRLKPRGRVVLIMTRWHPDDLGGRLLEHDPSWRVIKLPALAEADDPLKRAPGEALWPEWEDVPQLARKRSDLGERQWAAMFQQAPRPPGDTLFKLSKLETTDSAAPVVSVRAWDLAATAEGDGGNPDWTVGLKLCREASGRFVVLDVVRLRGSPHEVERAIIATAAADGPLTAISLPQDPGQAGKAQVRYLVSALAGYRVGATPETGSKLTRATPVASQVEAGNMALLHGGWNATFIDEMREFPNGRKDDQVDALSRAFAALLEAGAPARRVASGFMTR
jgi:predicted phage terminase large subunit-like protein